MREMSLSRRDFFKIVGVSSLSLVAIGSVKVDGWFPVSQPVSGEWRYSSCIICGQGCPIKIWVVNGKILHHVAHNFDPRYEGYFAACGRPRALADVWNHPDRIRKPMIRVDERGSGEFREISWDEALDYAAENLRKYLDKPEQIVVFSHQGCEKGIIKSFAHLLGTPNVTNHADTCHTSADAGRWFLFGKPIGPGGMYHDYERAQFIVFMARNPYGGIVSTPWAKVLSAGVSKGARIAVFEVRYSDICEVAERYFLVKPGTDLAVSLAMAREIIIGRHYDSAYLRRFTNAAMLLDPRTLDPIAVRENENGKLDYLVYDEELREFRWKSESVKPSLEFEGEYEGREATTALKILERVLEPYSPEWASRISGVRPSDIRWVAENLYSYAPRAFIDGGYKAVKFVNDPMLWRVNALVNVLLGAWGRRGGIAWPRKLKIPSPFKAKPREVESIISYWRKNGYPLASSKSYSMLALKSILEERPYPIKAAIISLQNLVSHVPDYQTVIKALNKLEFVMILDVMWNETCRYADLILPVPFFFELDNASLYGVSKANIGQVSLMSKAVDPPEDVDAKPPAWIVYQLVKRLLPEKVGEVEIILRPEEVWRKQCEKLGINYDMLRRYGTLAKYSEPVYHPLSSKGSLPTLTGEIELINLKALEMFREHIGKQSILNPLPTWVPPAWMEKELAEDEFIPIDYMHNLSAINTWARNTKLLIEPIRYEGKDRVFMHIERAAKLGIKDGDEVELYHPESGKKLRAKVKLTRRISKEVIAGIHGLNPGPHEGGRIKFTYMPKHGINTNYLAPFRIIPATGSAALFDFRIRVRRVVA